MWYSSSWKYRRKLTIDRTKVSGSSELIDFPVLISHIDAAMFANAQSNGQDILFTDDAGNKLAHEIEKFDQTTKRITAWVKIPKLSPFKDTILYIYWGAPYVTDQSNKTAVWDNNFVGIYHLSELPSGSSGQIKDSTSNANNGTTTGLTSVDQVDGMVDGSLDYAGSTDVINVPHHASIGFVDRLTISAFVKFRSFGPSNVGRIVRKTGVVNDGYDMFVNGSTKAMRAFLGTQDITGTANMIPAFGPFYKLTLTFDRTLASNQIKMFVNGIAAGVATRTTAIVNNAAVSLQIGNNEIATRATDGLIDEVRISNIARSQEWDLTEYNSISSPQTFYALANQEFALPIQKHYFYKIYDDGVYVNTWTKEIISEPRFRSGINGSAGELIIHLGRPFDDFGEDVDVKLNNRVDCYVVDKDNPNGLLLYSGYISGYIPSINKEQEKVEITVLGFAAEFQRMILRDASGNTTLTYSSQDPSNILKDVIDKYRARGGSVRYSSQTIELTNTTVSYTFQANTIKECLDKIIELCPIGWFWRVDSDGFIYLQPKHDTADHTFTLGLEIEHLETFRRIEDLVNRVLFVGAGSPALYRVYENTGSQGSYGMYEKKIVDQRVSVVATASQIANREIDSKKDPEIRSIFVIVDNNGPRGRGYNIESIKPGQTLKVKNLRADTRTISLWDVAFWDTDVWDQTLTTSAADVIQIQSVQYEPNSVKIEASSRLPQIAKRIEDVQRNLEVTQSQDLPTAPS